ncbi:MAG: hypothetical protein DWQ30_17410 [Acidobacteria bacterium]|nr:MAG: hypothetical protein DWQ30_17410 [Acidobacteriota bacterium]
MQHPTARRASVLASLIWLASLPALSVGPGAAQTSAHALRFHGTGVGPPGQQDRILLPVDDNQPGTGGNTPIDVGDGDFTIEWWMRGRLEDNQSTGLGGDVESFDYSWIDGNILLDRDVWCGTARAFGVSIRGGRVAFGTDTGDGGGDFSNTIEGSELVLDDTWHHVAVVRDASDGRKRIYVDGQLDFTSSPTSFEDLSYPDAGVPVTGNCGTGQLTPYGWYLVVAAEKHDAGPAYPSYAGYFDELRLWSTARSASQIAQTWDRLVEPSSPGLVGMYRLEEGSGVVVSDGSVAGSPDGDLRAGVAGNGEWVSAAVDPANTAPIVGLVDLIFADGFEAGDLAAWSASTP